MKYEDQKLLLEFARLQLAIAVSRNPTAAMDVTDATITRSVGFKKLRAWFARLSPRAKLKGRKFLRDQIEGTRLVMAEAKRTGEALSLGDIVFDFVDGAGEKLPEAPRIDAAQQCPGSGAAVQFMRKDDAGKDWVGCSSCDAQWAATEIDGAGGTLPVHAEAIHVEPGE